MKVHLPNIVGGSYGEFWRYQGRYRVIKGGRGSKKSTTAALWLIYQIMKFWQLYKIKPHALVIRRYFNTHQGSTFNQLRWAIERLHVAQLWRATKSPLQLVYVPSGQCIYFRGLDDPQSITSIVAADGHLCWVWWEEAFQVNDESAFDMVDLSIRGELPAPLFKQHTLTMNPWSEKHWIKRRFFDAKSQNILALTRNYDCNEFLGEDDIALFEEIRQSSPRRYAIEGRGEWGISEGLVFENWQERDFDFEQMQRSARYHPQMRAVFGLDFGYSNDPTAFIACIVDSKAHEIFIAYEIYKTGMLNSDIYKAIQRLGFDTERIVADSAEPKSIQELKLLGLRNIKAAKKGPDSVIAGIQLLQDYRIFVHPRCENTIIELSNYCWAKDRLSGRLMNMPIDEYNHAIDALRYATEGAHRRSFRW
ncbi:MAG: PBSX family phage terminase large subunit [Bacteroidales bacterium]|jgi:phage terminase large subunit|nr:PBSX family phage terminase large subunit [Bacteroidales bacterium]